MISCFKKIICVYYLCTYDSFYNNQWFSIGLRFGVDFLSIPFLLALYPVFNRFFLIHVLIFTCHWSCLTSTQLSLLLSISMKICADFILGSLGPRSTNNQLFLHVVDTAVHLLSISCWHSWPVFKCFCQNYVSYNSCNWPQFEKYQLVSFWTI